MSKMTATMTADHYCRRVDHVTFVWRHRGRPAVAEVVARYTKRLYKVRAPSRPTAAARLAIGHIATTTTIIIIVIITGRIISGVSVARDRRPRVRAAAAAAVRPARRRAVPVATRCRRRRPRTCSRLAHLACQSRRRRSSYDDFR